VCEGVWACPVAGAAGCVDERAAQRFGGAALACAHPSLRALQGGACAPGAGFCVCNSGRSFPAAGLCDGAADCPMAEDEVRLERFSAVLSGVEQLGGRSELL
jgi:hypothetical protein